MQEALRHLKASDSVMGRLIDELGPYGIEYSEPGFEMLVKSIIYQQLSGRVAAIIFERLAVRAGNGCMTPEAVLRLRTPTLRRIGLSQQKINYIRELARRTVSGEIDFRALLELPDEDVCDRLTALKGVGPWTVQMFLIFGLRRLDVLPSADLGIRAAVRNVYGFPELPQPAQIEDLARTWRPYRTVASWYLWRSLGDKAGM
jgi:DNA-3-methyladenine glycosylase II